jgi:hypothetical protein
MVLLVKFNILARVHLRISYLFKILFISISLCMLCRANAVDITMYDLQKSKPASDKQCMSCHEGSQHDWKKSDHAKLMATADKQSVLADFNHVDVEHYGQQAHFFITDNRY